MPAQIEHLGTVTEIVHDEGGCTLTIGDSAPILGDCHIGDSIAVNGACLTAVAFDKEEHGGWFKVWLANETLDRTDLGALPCLPVNEVHTSDRALRHMLLASAVQARGRSAIRSTWSARWGRMSASEVISCRCAARARVFELVLTSNAGQAHVDTTATLIDKTPDGDSVRLLFQLPEPTP